jgi:CheY-like chemotaxis protein
MNWRASQRDIPVQMAWLLIVDDDSDLREVLSELLRYKGYDVRAARDGAEALGLLDAAPKLPDAILLDLSLPGLDGLGVLRSMRGTGTTKQVPVIVLTGSVPAELSGCDVYTTLLKPVGIDALVDVIEGARRACRSPNSGVLG